jgi:demethylmenaquinone methyltransferase/2-methoxy-6-polyprenyl-1,4-benzoquinol methylase
MGYALRHVPDLEAAFAEYRRVLRPGGKVLLLEIGRPAGRFARAALRLYLGRFVPALSRWLGGGTQAERMMRYYWDTIDACVPPEDIARALTAAGFTSIACDVQLGIFRAWTAVAPPSAMPDAA